MRRPGPNRSFARLGKRLGPNRSFARLGKRLPEEAINRMKLWFRLPFWKQVLLLDLFGTQVIVKSLD